MTSTTCSKQFTQDAVLLLRSRLNDADSPADFLTQADELASNPDMLLEREPVELAAPLTGGPARDGDNAISLYEAVGPIDRANAAMPGLWTYMAFTTCRAYMTERWPLKEDGNWKNTVQSRWLLPRTTSRSRLVRQGLSRLWWGAELTYDGTLSHTLSARKHDPYAYTRLVFAYQNLYQQLFDRGVGDDPKVMWAFMDAAADYKGPENPSEFVAALGRDTLLEMSSRQLGLMDDTSLETFVTQVGATTIVNRPRRKPKTTNA
ncbi:hypothetical protein COO72_05085 [Bifidobacterium callitrichos]|nr:hypothetical protein COO72_05085 [Bifidobacterium callitrichos]